MVSGRSIVSASLTGLPMHNVSRSAKSAAFASTKSAQRRKMSIRSRGGRKRQRPSSHAVFAEATARSMSAAVPQATSATMAPFAGLITSKRVSAVWLCPPIISPVSISSACARAAQPARSLGVALVMAIFSQINVWERLHSLLLQVHHRPSQRENQCPAL